MDIDRSIGDMGSIADSTLKSAGQCLLFGGDVIGDYRVESLLGTGGMGQVYLVENIQMGKQYALKILPQELSASEGFVSRFRIDARRVSDMRHSNIANLHYFGQDASRQLYYIVTDYIQVSRDCGCTLEGYLQDREQMPEAEVLAIAGQICEALEYAHTFQGGCVLHCALKPSNILLDDTCTPILTDFGLTNITGDDYVHSLIDGALSASMADQSVGGAESLNENNPEGARFFYASLMQTREYMAPEVQGKQAPTVCSDIYSAGMILYRMLTGRTAKGRWKVPSEYGCSKAWDSIVVRAMDVEPAKRYPSMMEMLAAVRNVSLDDADYTKGIRADHHRESTATHILGTGINAGSVTQDSGEVAQYCQFINSKARSLGRFGGLFVPHPLIKDTDTVDVSAQNDVVRIFVKWIREVRTSDLDTEAGPPPPGHEPLTEKKPFDIWAYKSCYSKNWERQTVAIQCIPAKYTASCDYCRQSGDLTCPECHGNKTFVCPECQGESKKWILKRCKRCSKTGEIVCQRCKGTGRVSCPKCKGTRMLTTYDVIQAKYVPETATSIRRCDAPSIPVDDPIPAMAVGTVLFEDTYGTQIPSFIHHSNKELSSEVSAFANRVVSERKGQLIKLLLRVEQIPRVRITVHRGRRSFAIDLCGSAYELQPVGRLPFSFRPIIGAALVILAIVLIVAGIAFLNS